MNTFYKVFVFETVVRFIYSNYYIKVTCGGAILFTHTTKGPRMKEAASFVHDPPTHDDNDDRRDNHKERTTTP